MCARAAIAYYARPVTSVQNRVKGLRRIEGEVGRERRARGGSSAQAPVSAAGEAAYCTRTPLAASAMRSDMHSSLAKPKSPKTQKRSFLPDAGTGKMGKTACAGARRGGNREGEKEDET